MLQDIRDHEGYMALLVSIVKGVPQTQAFALLRGVAVGGRENARHLTDSQMWEIGQMRADGKTWKEIGEVFHVSTTGVHQMFRSWAEDQDDLPQEYLYRMVKYKFKEDDYEQIAKMREEGVIWREIANKYKLSVATVKRRFQEWQSRR